MHASLVEKDTREDVLLIKDTRSKEDIHLFKDNRTKATTGSSVSSLYPLKDIEGNGQESGFFVFPDLSVRMEGTYRLKFCLYEMVGKDVHFCAHVISEPLVVFSAKKFPGMEESTVLSQYFADQGLKLRIRKEVRPKKRTRGEYIGIEPKSLSPADSQPQDQQEPGDSQEDEDSAAATGLPANPKRRASGTRSVDSRRATTPHLEGKSSADGSANPSLTQSQKNRPWRSPLPEHLETPQRLRTVQEPYAQSRPPYFDETPQVARRQSATNKATEGVSQLDLNEGPRSEEEYYARAQEAHLFREREYAAQAARAGALGPYRGGSGTATPRTSVQPGHYPSGSPSTPFARNPDHPSHAARARTGEPIDPKAAELYDDFPEEPRRGSFAGPHRHPMYDPRLGRHPRDPLRGAPYPPDGMPADGAFAYPPYPGYPGRPRSADYGPYPGDYYRAGPHPYDRPDHLMRSADDLPPHYPPYPYHLHRDLYDPRAFDDYGYPRFRPGSQADPYAGYPYRYPPLHGKYPSHDGMGHAYTMAEVDAIAMGKHPYPYPPHEPGTPYSRQGPGAAGYPPVAGDPLGRPLRDELGAPYTRDPREPREPRDPRDGREPRDPRDLRDPRDPRDPREARDPRDPRDPRVASPPHLQDYAMTHYPHPLARGAYGPPGEGLYGLGRDRDEDLRQRPVALGHPGYPPYAGPPPGLPSSGAAAGSYSREGPSSYPYGPYAIEGILPRSSSMDNGLDGHTSFGHARSASSSNLPRAGHPPVSAAVAAAAAAATTAPAGGSAGGMALPLTRRASHAFGSESQLDQERAGASEGRENASNYAAAHPGPRRSDPSPYGAAGRSMDSYGALLPGYSLRGPYAHAAAVAASYYHGHAPPGYPAGAYPPHFPGHTSAHGHAGQQGQGPKQDDKMVMSQSDSMTVSQSAASAPASLASQANPMSVQAIPEHQKVSAA
ncbi:hypothetical protein BGX24_007898 [Mortierella sp. AD032]|nr:hypothetical protein BGX24_007898 [Mortierella sp. AD032]